MWKTRRERGPVLAVIVAHEEVPGAHAERKAAHALRDQIHPAGAVEPAAPSDATNGADRSSQETRFASGRPAPTMASCTTTSIRIVATEARRRSWPSLFRWSRRSPPSRG